MLLTSALKLAQATPLRLFAIKYMGALAVFIVAGHLSMNALAQTVPDGIESNVAQGTRGIALDLLGQLGQTLKAAMSTEGPLAAVSVCKDKAPAIAHELSARHGAKVSRVGTRVRNPKSGQPNAWQQEALTEFETRLAQGEKPSEMEYWRVVENAGGQRELRYAKAIVTQAICLSCHGSKEDIPAALAEKIRIEYPADQATGYSLGKLRGAVVVTKPL